MTHNRPENTKQNKPMSVSHKMAPQNKDDLDSREGEEQHTKGDDITHNKKETKEGHLKGRGKDDSR